MSEKKNDLKTELDAAFNLISALPVSGDGVDIMAAARDHLRTAYKLTEDKDAVLELYKSFDKKGENDG